MNPFDVLNSINYSKEDILDADNESKYPAFMVNRGLSYHQDTVLLANEMNRATHLDNRLQYDFLLKTIRSRKRFSKWYKKSASADIDVIKQYYGYSDAKAESVADLISADDIKAMKSQLSQGGKKR